MGYTPEERELFVSLFLKNNNSVILAQREFRRRFPRRVAPTGQTLRRLAARFKETGSTRDKSRRGRPRSSRSVENIAVVAADVKEDPHTTIRRRAKQLGIDRRSLQRILVEDLKMTPDKEGESQAEVVNTAKESEKQINARKIISTETDKYSASDAYGLPTHDKDDNEITKTSATAGCTLVS